MGTKRQKQEPRVLYMNIFGINLYANAFSMVPNPAPYNGEDIWSRRSNVIQTEREAVGLSARTTLHY